MEAPIDSQEFGRWREEADRALAHARLAAGAELYNWACFSAEQSAQLAVKALLHGLGRAPWGHDLVSFADELEAVGLALSHEARDAFLRLGRHYMPARYPDAHPAGSPGGHYGPADARQALGDAETVLSLIDLGWDELDG